MTHWECGMELNRQYFSSTLGKPVEVEIKNSVISGSDKCKFFIHF
jgi:hypothetical protein